MQVLMDLDQIANMLSLQSVATKTHKQSKKRFFPAAG